MSITGPTPSPREVFTALLDFEAMPGRYPVALREPRILFDNTHDILVLAAGRTVEGLALDPDLEARVRHAARFFVRAAMLRPGVDHYTLLGLAPGFEATTLRDHYRLMIRMTHPDFAAAGEAWPADAATRINLANDVLSSPVRKHEYDRGLPRSRLASSPGVMARPLVRPMPIERPRRPDSAGGPGRLRVLSELWGRWSSGTRMAVSGAVAALGVSIFAMTGLGGHEDVPVASIAAPPLAAPARQPPVAEPVKVQEVAPAMAAPPSAPQPPAVIPPPAPAAVAVMQVPQKALPPAAPAPVSVPEPRALPVVPSSPPRVVVARVPVSPTPAPVPQVAPVLKERPAVQQGAPMPATSTVAARAPVRVGVPEPATVQPVSPSAPPPSLPPVQVAAPVPAVVPAVVSATPLPVSVPATSSVPAAPVPVVAAVPAAPAPRISMADVQPALAQVVNALQSGRGEDALQSLDWFSRRNASSTGFVQAYNAVLAGSRVIKLGQMHFRSRAAADQMVVDGVIQLHLQDDSQRVATRDFHLRAYFVARDGGPALTRLAAGGAE